LSMC